MEGVDAPWGRIQITLGSGNQSADVPVNANNGTNSDDEDTMELPVQNTKLTEASATDRFASIDYLRHYDASATDSESSDEEERDARRPWKKLTAEASEHNGAGLPARLAALNDALRQASTTGMDARSAAKLISRYEAASQQARDEAAAAGGVSAAAAFDAALGQSRSAADAAVGHEACRDESEDEGGSGEDNSDDDEAYMGRGDDDDGDGMSDGVT